MNCLNFRYFFKASNAALTATCNELDFWVTTSPDDLVTFDVGGLVGGENALYGDSTTVGEGGKPLSLTGWLGPKSFIGCLTVETGIMDAASGSCIGMPANPPTAPQPLPPDGEAVIQNLAQGTSWAYRALSNHRYHEEQAILGNGNAAPTSWLPPNFAKTEFVVTPVDLEGTGAKSSVVRLVVFPSGLSGQYDRNEFLYSGNDEREVTCVGVVNINDLMSQAHAANPALNTQGGWSYLNNAMRPDVDLVNDAWVYKVETYSKYGLVNGTLPPVITRLCGTFPNLVLCGNFPLLGSTSVNAVPNGGKSLFITAP